MAYTSDNEIWESEFDNIVIKKDKVQVMIINQLKLELKGNYEKDEKKQQLLNLLIMKIT